MEYKIIEEVKYTPNANRFVYVVTNIDNEYAIGERHFTYADAVIEYARLNGVSEEEVRKVVGDYFIFNAIYLVSFSVQDMYDQVNEFLKENDLKNYKEGIKLLVGEMKLVDGGYGYVEENIKDIKKVYSEYSENDYGDDVSNMDNKELALYLGISEQEVEDDRDSSEEQARGLMNDPEQDF